MELATFLRNRRGRLLPRDVALPGGGRRQVPGLRRQEVAQLAGLSVDYYIRLEQGRGPHPSRQALSALARALMLTGDERAHLFELAGEPPGPPSGPSTVVTEATRHLLDVLDQVPAHVMDAKYDLLAWNPLSAALVPDLIERSRFDRNIIRYMFSSPGIREQLADEQRGRFPRSAVADLRVAAGRYPKDKGVHDLVAEMLALSPEFAAVWTDHEVRVQRTAHKTIHHPIVGPIDLECQVLAIPEHDQRLVVHTTVPGSPSQRTLARLQEMVGS